MAGDIRKRSEVSQEKQSFDNQSPMDQVFQAATRGWRLFPVKPRDKMPLIKGWPEFATTDVAILGEWLRKHPNCNWGLGPAGTQTGGLNGKSRPSRIANRLVWKRTRFEKP